MPLLRRSCDWHYVLTQPCCCLPAGAPAGAGKPKDWDRSWPFDAWASGSCADVLVDPSTGDDYQSGSPPYAKPFKTISAALLAVVSRQCNRYM